MSTLHKEDGLTGEGSAAGVVLCRRIPSSLGNQPERPKRKVNQPKTYREPSSKTKLRNDGSVSGIVAAPEPANKNKQKHKDHQSERFAFAKAATTSIGTAAKRVLTERLRYSPSSSSNDNYLSSSASQTAWQCNGRDCSAKRSFTSNQCDECGILSCYREGTGALLLKERPVSVVLSAASDLGIEVAIEDDDINEVVDNCSAGEEEVTGSPTNSNTSEPHDNNNNNGELADADIDTEVQVDINGIFNEVADNFSIGEEDDAAHSPNFKPASPTNSITTTDTTRQHHDEHSHNNSNGEELAYAKAQLSNLQLRYDAVLQEKEDLQQKLATAQAEVARLKTQNDELETALHNESISFGLKHMKLDQENTRLRLTLKPKIGTSTSSPKNNEPNRGRPALGDISNR